MSVDTRTYGKTIVAILGVLAIIHLAVLSGVLSMSMVWGGRLQHRSELLLFELFSLVINGVVMLVVAMKSGLVINRLPQRVLQAMLWGSVVLFLLSTLGSFSGIHPLEKWVLGPLAFVLALLILRLTLTRTEKGIDA